MAAPMDLVSPITGIFLLFWDCTGRRVSHIIDLKEELNSLRLAMEELKNVRDDVKRRVEAAEGQLMTRTNYVHGWLQRVDFMEVEVDDILERGSQQVSRRCLGGCCPKNFCSSYKIGKRVAKKLRDIAELRSKGDFEVVAESSAPAPVEMMPSMKTVGMDSMFEKVWRCLAEEEVGVIGLYGMGGVGKTTLLKKINNELFRTIGDFDVVIWIVVSKDLNVRRIQKDIGNKLGLTWQENLSQDAQAADIFRALSKKKFVLLLDDIWDRVNMEVIGIPLPSVQNKSKVVFTTRSEAVCGRMDTQRKIRVECLAWPEAWSLFQDKVGEENLNSHPEITHLAEICAKECAGLPLALITIGRAMASKKTPEEWKYTITILKKFASEFSGMGDEVFPLLKFSYDSLRDDTLRSCFIYCSLFPEDYSIMKEELIQYWIGEGFLEEFDDLNEARNQGYDIIGALKLACLLESGANEEMEVKMHDVIRDMALWIASDYGFRKDKFLVQAGAGLSRAPRFGKWKEAERISLMANDIRSIIEIPVCPNLSTFILRGNRNLERFSEDFFQFMHALRVLDLSRTGIKDLPVGIVELVELRYLNLSRTGIRYLPLGIVELVELRYLNLSRTEISTLPLELINLVKLKYLNLSFTHHLRTIPGKVISGLSELEVLDLHGSVFTDWKTATYLGASLGELEFLECLKALGIVLKDKWALFRFLESQKLQRCTVSLSIEECRGLTVLPLSPLGNMKYLKELVFTGCLDLEEFQIRSVVMEGQNQICFPNLVIGRNGCFQDLRKVTIEKCNVLKALTWLQFVAGLQVLSIASCRALEEIIGGDDGYGRVAEVGGYIGIFSRLKCVHLSDLQELNGICRHALPFPCLEEFTVINCPKLKKLPFDSNSAKNTLKGITGATSWWDDLEWENEVTRSIFLPHFHDYY